VNRDFESGVQGRHRKAETDEVRGLEAGRSSDCLPRTRIVAESAILNEISPLNQEEQIEPANAS
jgi:hypothetical protein